MGRLNIMVNGQSRLCFPLELETEEKDISYSKKKQN